MKIKQLSVILVVSMITGCAVYGPTYEKPKVDVNNDWYSKDSLAKIESGVKFADIAWWSKFNDPQLN
ncbi:MAG: hypothetical protein K2P99_06755, partial [Burkholderiales bacterium]|nr:hypothetical protein [Burkholderiales bacterium]